MLDRLQLSFRCPADWEAMEGDEQRRFCSHCQKHVHDLSAMSRDEAAAVVTKGGEVCVRMTRRADGSLVTKGCPKTVAARSRAVRMVGAGLAAGGALALASCEKSGTLVPDGVAVPDEGEALVMGEMMAPEPEAVPEMGKPVAPEPAVMGLMCPIAEPDVPPVEE